jgi:UDP-3-O-[3-hydroxymyristoyl] glucosamine N-acyltransferase
MEFSAIQLATFLSGTVEGNPEVKVYNVAKIEEGAPGMLSFLANPKYSQYLYTTKSSIVLVNNDFELKDKVSATLIRVPDAYAAFAQLLGLYQQFMQSKSGVSSLSFISKDASYGEDVYIGEFAFVGERVKIGDRVKIGAKSGIDRDIPDGEIRFGSPALAGINYHRSFAVFKELPELRRRVMKLEAELAKKEE